MTDSINRLNAALEGRYQIERELGQGGMATVYLAADLKHARNVALKVLKPDLTAALGAERFHVEIKTTANLQHPHILSLLDSGEAAGLLFYTMPFVEGETLRERLEREGTFPIDEAVRIALDVADALGAAHERGVVHRDVKPSNILLSRGGALVADFGIAQAAAYVTGSRLTQVGSSIGTAGYMSPEQASEDVDVDQRSDIYSLACVLFEMLAGEPPYAGNTVVQVLAKQLTAPAPSVRTIRPEVPSHVEKVLSAALSTNPWERPSDTAEFSHALSARPLHNSDGAGPGNTILVLPFVNRSPDPDNEYFSDGLTDEVISDLSGVSALRVISRNSAMALKGTTKDTPTLARELGATHLVTGTVRRAGKALRITADLIEASTDSSLWSQKFSGTVEDVFGIQEEISREIVSALEVRLTGTEERDVASRPIEDAGAYDCYLRARQLMYEWTPDAQQRAMMLVEEATGIVGETPVLLATKGQIHWNMVQAGIGPTDGLVDAKVLIDKALALDPSSYLAIFVHGLVAGTMGGTEEALEDLHRAHRLRPGDANVLTELCRYALSSGLPNTQGILGRLVQVDPLTPVTHLLVSMNHFLGGELGAAADPARRAIRLAPDPSMLHVVGSWHIASAGFHDEAVSILDRVAKSGLGEAPSSLALFLKCALTGDAEEALRPPTPQQAAEMPNEHLLRHMVDGYAMLGRPKDAVRLLRAALGYGFINYPHLTRHPTLRSLQDDPDFRAILTEIQPRWEAVVDWQARSSV